MPPVTRSRTHRERQQLRESSSRQTGNERSDPHSGSQSSATATPIADPESTDEALAQMFDALTMFEPSTLSRSELRDARLPSVARLREDPLSGTRSEVFRLVTRVIVEHARRDSSLAWDIANTVPLPYRSLDEVLRSIDRDFFLHEIYLNPSHPLGTRSDAILTTPQFLTALQGHYLTTQRIREEEGHDRITNELAVSVHLKILDKFSNLAKRDINFRPYVPPINGIIEDVAAQESSVLEKHLMTRRRIVYQFEQALDERVCDTLDLSRLSDAA